MGYLVGIGIIVAVTVIVLVFAFGRAGRRRTRTQPGRPEEEGTSYEEPQDEGPQP